MKKKVKEDNTYPDENNLIVFWEQKNGVFGSWRERDSHCVRNSRGILVIKISKVEQVTPLSINGKLKVGALIFVCLWYRDLLLCRKPPVGTLEIAFFRNWNNSKPRTLRIQDNTNFKIKISPYLVIWFNSYEIDH